MTNTPIPFYNLGGQGIDAPKILGAVAALTGSEIYLCGKCYNITTYGKNDTRPVRCDICADEFSWVGVKTKLIKKCPVCGKIDKTNSKLYCNTCPTPIHLIDEEVDL